MWWVMITVAALVGVTNSIPCEDARVKCAYRVGCGMALQNYVVGCSGVLQGPPPTHCPEICHHSLIALTSTEQGKALMNCECSDDYCRDQKRRTEICRPQVMKLMNEPIVSCRVAQWICSADALCSTALDYYNHYCRAMFHGKKCTPRCNNSISILRRQDKAIKLTMCKCDGLEDYDCLGIQRNMEKLCFHNKRARHRQNTTSKFIGGRNGHTPITIPITTTTTTTKMPTTISPNMIPTDNRQQSAGGCTLTTTIFLFLTTIITLIT